MRRNLLATLVAMWLAIVASHTAYAADLIPPLEKIKTDRPRLLLRPEASPFAVSLAELKATGRDADFRAMLAQLRSQRSPAAQAMVWLLTGEKAAAERAIASMRGYEFPGRVDTFHTYFNLRQFALAYDWLYHYEGFTDEIKAEVRRRIMPLARHGLKVAHDHVFHNYIWMSACGTWLWALATAGEDDEADRLFEQIAGRFNHNLFPAMQYLDGLPSEPMGYWALYDFSSAVLALLGAQSAFETDLVGAIEKQHGDWLDRHFENLIHSTLPNMRFIPWGDLQSGPNGGVTHEMAGVIDAVTWALRSPHGAYFGNWLAQRRGLRRFHGEEAIFYMLYSRRLKVQPAVPPLSFMAGNRHSGHFIARSGWGEGDTVVALTCTDHFGDHNHYDQGSFTIYRNGLLAVDPPVYRRIRGPQQDTKHHNTLMPDGRTQRTVRGQSFVSVEEFRKNLTAGRKLETGDMLFHRDEGTWAAAACQFAQAYDSLLVQSCVRQLLFVRPGTVVIVDHLVAPAGGRLPEVHWLLQVPQPPEMHAAGLTSSHGKSWIRCRPMLPGGVKPIVTATPVNTHSVDFAYPGKSRLTLVHVLEVGDGERPGPAAEIQVTQRRGAVEVHVAGKAFTFGSVAPFGVSAE